jgi:hypothetical protein
LLVEELTALALAVAEGNVRSPVDFAAPPAGAPTGWSVDQWRAWKGLPRVEGERKYLPVYLDPGALRSFNNQRDIVPLEGLAALHSGDDLPWDGLFLGRGWHGLECEGEQLFRWLDTDGEVIVTNLTASPRALVIDVESGPSRQCEAFELLLMSEQGERIGAATVSYRHPITLNLPEIASGSAIFRLVAPAGGIRLPGDNRILNLRVFQIRRISSET